MTYLSLSSYVKELFTEIITFLYLAEVQMDLAFDNLFFLINCIQFM